MDSLEGIILKPLKIIPHPKGDIMHALKGSESEFFGFGEAYFSTVNTGEIKGWKMHQRMTLNIIVPTGQIKFVLFDERPDSKTKGKFWQKIIGEDKYERLTIPPLIWMAFQGISPQLNLLLNIASVEHNPAEAETRNLKDVDFNWGL